MHDPATLKVTRELEKLNNTFDKLTFRSIETEWMDTLRVYNKAWEPLTSNDTLKSIDESLKILINEQMQSFQLLANIDNKLSAHTLEIRDVVTAVNRVYGVNNSLNRLFNEKLLVRAAKDTDWKECLRVWDKSKRN